MSAGNWCLIESDPGVFSELIADLGVKGVNVEELYGLDESSLASVRPVYGLIFLFKWDKALQSGPCIQHDLPDLFFAKQVIQNACATQAILSVLLNTPGIELGPELSELKVFAREMPSEYRGLVLSNSEKIRTVHNSFARQETFEIGSGETDKDAFHFVAYVPFQGRVLELDGLQEAPIDHGAYEDDWLATAASVIQKRIERYSQSEIRFNLLAVAADKQVALEARLATVQARMATPRDDTAVQLEVNDLEEEIRAVQSKRAQQKAENERRRFNYIPFFIEALKALAGTGRLPALAQAATVPVGPARGRAAPKQ